MKRQPNGLAQRQRRGRRDAPALSRHFWKTAPVSERQSRCPLEPVLGSTINFQAVKRKIRNSAT